MIIDEVVVVFVASVINVSLAAVVDVVPTVIDAAAVVNDFEIAVAVVVVVVVVDSY